MKKKKLKTLQLKKIVISRLDPDTSHGIKGGADTITGADLCQLTPVYCATNTGCA